MKQSHINDPWEDFDDITSESTKMNPEEVWALERAFQKGGMENVDRYVKGLEPIESIITRPKLDKEFPVISQSLIKYLISKGDEKQFCPQQFYRTWITKDVNKEPSLAMLQGQFAETLFLGGGARGNVLYDLPRNKKNGAKTIDQERIEAQILALQKYTVPEYNLTIVPGVNTQVILKKIIQGKLCQGELDLISPIFYEDKHYYGFCDFKATANVNSTFGYEGSAGWGNAEEMDHIQMDMYHELIRDIDWELNSHLQPEQINLLKKMQDKEILGYYLVMDYKVPMENLSRKVFIYEWNALKRAQLMETIRKTISIIEFYNASDEWDRCEQINCDKCNVLDCIFKNKPKKL